MAQEIEGEVSTETTKELSPIEKLREGKQRVHDAINKLSEANAELKTAKDDFEKELRDEYRGKWVRINGFLDAVTVWDNGDSYMESSHRLVRDYVGYVTHAWGNESGSDEVQPSLYISQAPPSVIKQSEVRVKLFQLESIEVIDDPRTEQDQSTKVGAATVTRA